MSTKTIIQYEWVWVELDPNSVDDDGDMDIYENHFMDGLKDLEYYKTKFGRLELWRNRGSESEGLEDRQFAVVERGEFEDTTFDGGCKIPERYIKQLASVDF